MNYRLFIARRYLFSRKSHHAINIISGISTLSGSSTLSSVTNVLKSYKGIYIGFRMKK